MRFAERQARACRRIRHACSSNRKLNDRGRNVTFRGRFGYGDILTTTSTRQSETRYLPVVERVGRRLRAWYRNQYITTPTKNYNYSAQLTYSEPIARATFLQFSYQFQYKYSESDKTTFDLLGYPDWGLSTPAFAVGIRSRMPWTAWASMRSTATTTTMRPCRCASSARSIS